MFKVWILIAFFVLIKCSYDDLRTGYINLEILLLGTISLIVSYVLMYLLDCISGNTICYEKGEIIKHIIYGVIPGILLFFASKIIKGLGDGDAFVFMFAGAVMGFYDVQKIMFLSFLLSFIYALYMKVIKKTLNDYSYPFVPFILSGFVICTLINIYRGALL